MDKGWQWDYFWVSAYISHFVPTIKGYSCLLLFGDKFGGMLAAMLEQKDNGKSKTKKLCKHSFNVAKIETWYKTTILKV